MTCPTCRKAVLDTARLVGNLAAAAAGDESETKEQSAIQLQRDVLQNIEALAATLLAHEHHPAATEVQCIVSNIKAGGEFRPAVQGLKTLASET